MAEMSGLSVEAHIGLTLHEVLPDLAERLVEVCRPVYEWGEAVLDAEILFKEEVPVDVRLVRPSVERAESGLEVRLKGLVTDRGFDNKTNVKWGSVASL